MDVDSPAEQGVSAQGIARFLDGIEADPGIEPHGLIIQRHGHRIVEGCWAPHTGDRTRLVYSLSKTFTGTALGLLVDEGLLTLDDPVSDHLPELLAGADARTRRMKVRHIASMATGHDRELLLEASALDPADPVRGFFRIPPDAEPGTLFAYNQPPVLALATILQKVAGMRLTDYLRPRVLEPMGISGFAWTQTRQGVDLGFSGVHTTLDAVARLGQLHLDDGMWEGRRLLPEGWVALASSVQIENPQRDEPDWSQGYGYQLWRSRHGYRGDGAFGQFMVVLPEQDAVVAMFSSTLDMQVVLDLMWEHLLPAMGDTASAPTPDDAALAERMRHLALPTAMERTGGASAALTAASFTPGPTRASSQPTVSAVETAGDRIVVHEGDRSIEAPLSDGWTQVDRSLATSAALLPDGRVTVDLVFVETPHRLEVRLDPSAGTFTTRWPLPPIRPTRLTSLKAPAG